MAELDSVSQLFLIIVLQNMIYMACSAQPQIWVTRAARLHPFVFFAMADVFLVSKFCTKIPYFLRHFLPGQVLSPNDGN